MSRSNTHTDSGNIEAEIVDGMESGINNKSAKASSVGTIDSDESSGSALVFDNINFTVGSGDNEKKILHNISGKVKEGHVLAILGPSGAGKTTLISVLTMDAHHGTANGEISLNGMTMTGKAFKKHCFVVKQQDMHWPYLTTRETLKYAAGLYHVADTSHGVDTAVDEVLNKMGLVICADTRCSNLSGGQKRRLSIAVALLKQPKVLFLDEPTSGLDAASASSVMEEIGRVAKDEHLIIICTIHQPSTKVYNSFDQVMILTRGMEAFSGNTEDALAFFDSIGYPLPANTNPAEHYLDLVNSDFTSETQVNEILMHWYRMKPAIAGINGNATMKHKSSIDMEGSYVNAPILSQMSIMFHRHRTLIIRDPILYLGRAVLIAVATLVFAFVYWEARNHTLDNAYSKFWIQMWILSVPAQMAVVAVYALFDEFHSIQREVQNGMIQPWSYILAKFVLVIPVLFMFTMIALLIPSFVIQDVPWESFGECVAIYMATMFVFESVAEVLSVAFSNVIVGMLAFICFWFDSFLFGGFLIGEEDLYWPLKLFYYIFPFTYFQPSTVYVTFQDTDWEDTTASEALAVLHGAFPVVKNSDRVWEHVGTLIGIGMIYKLMYVGLVVIRTRSVSKIEK